MKLRRDHTPPSRFMMLPIVTTLLILANRSGVYLMLASSVETTAPPCEYPKTTTSPDPDADGAGPALNALSRFATPVPTDAFQVSHDSPGHQRGGGTGQNVAG